MPSKETRRRESVRRSPASPGSNPIRRTYIHRTFVAPENCGGWRRSLFRGATAAATCFSPPPPKSAVADFGHSVVAEPSLQRGSAGEGAGGGVERGGLAVPQGHDPPPPPSPSRNRV